MRMNIEAIPAPTIESESRKKALQDKQKTKALTVKEQNELLSLEMRQFWNCEC